MARKIARKVKTDVDTHSEVKDVKTAPTKVDRGAPVVKKKASIEEMLDRVRKIYRAGNGIDYKLAVPDEVKEDGYHYHYINDKRSRIPQMESLGYEIVNDLDGNPIKKVVNMSKTAEVQHAVLMRIPQEVYDEIKRLRYQRQQVDYKKTMKGSQDGLTGDSYSETREL